MYFCLGVVQMDKYSILATYNDWYVSVLGIYNAQA